MNRLLILLVLPLSACAPGDTVWVDTSAAASGDGSEARPFKTLDEALAQQDIVRIELEAGSYEAPAEWSFAAPLTIHGRGADLTILDGGARLAWTGSLSLDALALGSPLTWTGGELAASGVIADGLAGPSLVLVHAAATFQDLRVDNTTGGDELDQGDGVRVEGGTLSWTGGGATGNDERSLAVVGAEATLSGLELDGGSRAALFVSDASVVAAEQIEVGPSGVGIYLADARLELSGSQVTGATTAGLLAGAGADLEISDCDFIENPGGHVTAQGQGVFVLIEDSLFSEAVGGVCVSVASTAGPVSIRRNEIHDCAGNGISLSDLTGDVLVEDNEVREIRPDAMFGEVSQGIGLLHSEAQILRNRVYDSDSEAIALIGGGGVIEGNDIGPGLGAGVSVIEPAPANRTVVRDNIIDGVTAAGVLVLDADADVTGNVITHTAFSAADGMGEGVIFGSVADVTLTGNELRANSKNGVSFMDGATGTIEGNEITGNLQFGIKEFCVGAVNAVTVGDNVVESNALGSSSLCSR